MKNLTSQEPKRLPASEALAPAGPSEGKLAECSKEPGFTVADPADVADLSAPRRFRGGGKENPHRYTDLHE